MIESLVDHYIEKEEHDPIEYRYAVPMDNGYLVSIVSEYLETDLWEIAILTSNGDGTYEIDHDSVLRRLTEQEVYTELARVQKLPQHENSLS